MTKADQKRVDETYSEEETKARADATLKVMLTTPPKLHKDSKLGKKQEPSQN